MGLVNSLLQKGELLGYLAANGRIFVGSAAAQNTAVTGATSFATTTPTLLLDVPSGTTAFPLLFALNQTGTVAGDSVHVIFEFDNADRYTSGGTAATVLNAHTGHSRTAACSLYSATGSAITATNAYGVRDMALTMAQDVAPAEGVINEILWTPTMGPIALTGPAAFLVYAYAGTTGPTLWWTGRWGEVRSADFDIA